MRVITMINFTVYLHSWGEFGPFADFFYVSAFLSVIIRINFQPG